MDGGFWLLGMWETDRHVPPIGEGRKAVPSEQ